MNTEVAHRVNNAQFSLMSPEDIVKLSVIEVTESDTMDNGQPVAKGLFDLRMGTTERDTQCLSCGHDSMKCDGHFGHISLATPIIHLSFIKTIKQVLDVICLGCSNLLVEPQDKLPEQKRIKRMSTILSSSSKRICGHCGLNQPKILLIQKGDVYISIESLDNTGTKRTSELYGEDIIVIFKRMTNATIVSLGFDPVRFRPEWMIITKLIVAPPAMRPAMKREDNQRAEDDMTINYSNIIRENKRYAQKRSSDPNNKGISNLACDLTVAVGLLFDDTLRNALKNQSLITGSQKRPLESTKKRLAAKTGRFRNTLMGKRTNGSGRTVIGGDPNLDIGELGVPLKIAMNVTYPETVTPYNIDEMYRLVNNGPSVYPGAKKYIDSSGVERYLEFVKTGEIVLQFGDIVRRHLRDGDYVLLNRQPSLHKLSMLCHRVRVLHKGKTFRFNVADTKPYNADFDGDEMNMFVPSSPQTVAELKYIAQIERQIISPQMSLPVIGMVQEGLVGSYMLSNSSVKLTKYAMAELMMCNLQFNGIVPKSTLEVDAYAGRDAITTIIPKINMLRFNKGYSESQPENWINTKVEIHNGVMLSGELNNELLGIKKQQPNMIQIINNDSDTTTVSHFISVLGRMASQYLMRKGLTFGMRDITIKQETAKKITELLNSGDKINNAYSHINDVLNGKFIAPVGKSNREYFEMKMINEVSGLADDIGKEAIKGLLDNNSMKQMISGFGSGSKGQPLNVQQITACVGQQIIVAGRVPTLYGNRALPHFTKYDESPMARGFISHSFVDGLNPVEFFFHAISGRESSIDTAIKTADSGYISRKFIKLMEDLIVQYDKSVRNASDQIIQFVYADDALDPIYLERQCFETTLYSNIEMKRFEIPTVVLKGDSQMSSFNLLHKEQMNQMLNDRDALRRMRKGDTSISDTFTSCVNIRRLITNCAQAYGIDITTTTYVDLTTVDTSGIVKSLDYAVYIIESVNQLCDSLAGVYTSKVYKRFINATMLTSAMIRTHLNCKRVLYEYKLPRELFDTIITDIRVKYMQSVISSGEMCGIVSAQSIGEPSTQLTLNTFHTSGAGAKANVRVGIPRLKELIIVSKTESMGTPVDYITMKPDVKSNAQMVKAIVNQLKNETLENYIHTVDILYDPIPYSSKFPEDQKVIADHIKHSVLPPKSVSGIGKWVIRFVFDRLNTMTLDHIKAKIQIFVIDKLKDTNAIIISSDTSANYLIIRVSLSVSVDANDQLAYTNKCKNRIINEIVLRGVSGLQAVDIRKKTRDVIDNSTGRIISVEEYGADTDGSNLMELFNNAVVDGTRTISNSIKEVEETFGIEVARKLLYNEIYNLLSGEGVGYHHVSLLVDLMTYTGTLTPINRHGINKLGNTPLGKASFEETVEQIKTAALYTVPDNITGVSGNIVFSQIVRGGTGICDIVYDTDSYGVSTDTLMDIM